MKRKAGAKPARENASSMLHFPIVLRTGEVTEPPPQASALYYEVASNGVFQIRDAATHRAVTRVSAEIPGLTEEHESIELFFPRLPRDLCEDVLAFFYEVHRRWDGEAIVILFYDPQRERFEVGVPPQTIHAYTDAYGRLYTEQHLEYGQAPRPDGTLRLGTIHSHGDLAAYASHTDCKDEQYGDGLHVVFGNLTRSPISRSAAFVVNGRRFTLSPSAVLETADVPARGAHEAWLDQVEYVESASRYTWGAPVPVPPARARKPGKKGGHEVEH